MDAQDTYDDTDVGSSARVADDLARYLASVERDGALRVERVLGGGGEDRAGVTELVDFVGANGAAIGPIVRKRLDLAWGVGHAYEALLAAERAGRRFLHLPRIFDVYTTGTELVVLSEYVPGETLAERIARSGGSVAEARRWFPLLCDAVDELHGVADPPIIHRDLKPQNVIVADRALTLIDLGIARQVREAATSDTVKLGTRAYAPPEQFGFGQTDVRSDLYALGMVLLFCLTGAEPAVRLDAEALARAGVPSAVAEVVLWATAFDPADRPGSASELKRAFLHAVGEDVAAPPAPTPSASTPPAPTPRTQVAAGVASPRRTARKAWAEVVASAPKRPSSLAQDAPTIPRSAYVRDVAIVAATLLFVAASIDATFHPTGANVGKPLWYLVWIGVFIVIPFFVGCGYLLLDRRPVARIAPRLAARSRRRDAVLIGIGLVVSFVGLVVASGVAGV